MSSLTIFGVIATVSLMLNYSFIAYVQELPEWPGYIILALGILITVYAEIKQEKKELSE